MKDLARAAALLVAAFVLGRGLAVGNGVHALVQATWLAGAAVVLAAALLRDGFVTGAGVALGAHYALSLHYGDVAADYAAPVFAGLILVHMDLLDLASGLARERLVDRAFLLSRLRHLAGVFGVGALAAVAALAVASYRWPSATLTRMLGLAGVALAVAIPLGLLRARR
jgi:hypothetical protein